MTSIDYNEFSSQFKKKLGRLGVVYIVDLRELANQYFADKNPSNEQLIELMTQYCTDNPLWVAHNRADGAVHWSCEANCP